MLNIEFRALFEGSSGVLLVVSVGTSLNYCCRVIFSIFLDIKQYCR